MQDLLNLIIKYPLRDDIEYNIDMFALNQIKIPLQQLNDMIGLKQLKQNIIDQILFYIQKLHINSTNDFLHTVISGPPGTGKTEVAKIIGSIFSHLGILTKNTFKKVTRNDLIAGYLGQTAIKTTEIIHECLGGVLFIDEAYSLGNGINNTTKIDSFSKECLDTLCECLSDHKDNLMVIVAGYDELLNQQFFGQNLGLESRFTWRYHIDDYTSQDLYDIFIKKIKQNGWFLSNEEPKILVSWFEKYKHKFKFFGRDIETLFAKVKIAHSKRIFGLKTSLKKHINLDDLNNGFQLFEKNMNKQNNNHNHNLLYSMYV